MSWHYEPIFTFVRNPVFWLRSAWGHLKHNGWMPYPHIEIPWAHFVMMVIPYRSDDFESFATSVENRHSGIVSWLFSVYTPPRVVVHRIESKDYLRNAGCDVDRPPIGTGGNLPEISPELYRFIQDNEEYAFKKWYSDQMT